VLMPGLDGLDGTSREVWETTVLGGPHPHLGTVVYGFPRNPRLWEGRASRSSRGDVTEPEGQPGT
jgi:hypothetical protein